MSTELRAKSPTAFDKRACYCVLLFLEFCEGLFPNAFLLHSAVCRHRTTNAYRHFFTYAYTIYYYISTPQLLVLVFTYLCSHTGDSGSNCLCGRGCCLRHWRTCLSRNFVEQVKLLCSSSSLDIRILSYIHVLRGFQLHASMLRFPISR